jgi:beta-lactamase regulating signal transducer with metallopeptidase domain/protocatechuate 3,4-dioxygenase beta subunit
MNVYLNELAGMAWLQILQVTALAAGAGMLARLFCRRRPHLAYMLWILVLLKCLTPPLWSSPAGVFSLAQASFAPRQAATQANTLHDAAELRAPSRIAPSALERPNNFASGNPALVRKIPAGAIDNPATTRRLDLSWPAVLAAIWLAGALALTGIVLKNWLAFMNVLNKSAIAADDEIQSLSAGLAEKLGLRRKITVLITSESIGPAVFGLFRPAIALPRTVIDGKTHAQIEPIIAHELVHIRRGDTIWGFLQVAAEILWWFHPLVWWANRQTCLQRERCCDEEVVASLNCKPALYAHCLLDVLESERNWRPIMAVPGFNSVKNTSGRLEDIMIRAKYFNKKTPRWCWAFLAVAAVLILPGRAIVLGGGDTPTAQNQKQTTPTTEKTARQAKSETILTGQVIDPAGKPVPGAQVAIVGRSRRPISGGNFSDEELKTYGLTKSDAQGRFRFTAPRLSSAGYYAAYVLAAAESYGLGWRPIGLDTEQPNITVQLPREQIIRGRVVDDKGKPAADAKVCVFQVGQFINGETVGIQYWEPPANLPIWPGPASTDHDGRFTLRGVNRDQGVVVQIRDDRFARDTIVIQPADKQQGEELTLSPPPGQVVEGEVLYEDTHKPVPNARLTLYARNTEGRGGTGIAGTADEKGHFQLNPFSGDFIEVAAYPPDGQPYLAFEKAFQRPKQSLPSKEKDGQPKVFNLVPKADSWPQGNKFEMILPRGVLVQGKIIESASGKPVAGAGIHYEDQQKNPYMREGIVTGWQALVVSKDDGSFQIVVPPGPGILYFQGPENDYVYQTIGNWELFDTPAWGRRLYVNAFAKLDLKPDAKPADMNVSIRRGATVKGRLVGPDDRPADEVFMLSRLFIPPNATVFRGTKIIARGGQFELHGLDPEKSVPVYFLDSKNELGATMDISGKSAEDQSLVVRLSPCGKAVARFVDPDGKPLAKHNPNLQIVVTPGPSTMRIGALLRAKMNIDVKEPVSDEDFVANFDRGHYWNHPMTDDQGRCTFPALIPGATYRLNVAFDKSGRFIDKDFIVKPGETLDLGDIIVKEF